MKVIANFCIVQFVLKKGVFIDTRTVLKENINSEKEIDVFIDIFPLDYVDIDKPEQCKYFSNSFEFNIQSLKYINLKKERSVWKNALILLSRIVYPYSLHEIATMREKRAKSVATDRTAKWIANLHGAWKMKEIVPSDYFSQLSSMRLKEENTMDHVILTVI